MRAETLVGTGGARYLSIDARDVVVGDLTADGCTVVGVYVKPQGTAIEFIGCPVQVYGPGQHVLIHDDRF